MGIHGSDLDEDLYLEDIQFHLGSQHTVDGQRFPLEVCCDHQRRTLHLIY